MQRQTKRRNGRDRRMPVNSLKEKLCVCVCVCERERERDRDRHRGREKWTINCRDRPEPDHEALTNSIRNMHFLL